MFGFHCGINVAAPSLPPPFPAAGVVGIHWRRAAEKDSESNEVSMSVLQSWSFTAATTCRGRDVAEPQRSVKRSVTGVDLQRIIIAELLLSRRRHLLWRGTWATGGNVRTLLLVPYAASPYSLARHWQSCSAAAYLRHCWRQGTALTAACMVQPQRALSARAVVMRILQLARAFLPSPAFTPSTMTCHAGTKGGTRDVAIAALRADLARMPTRGLSRVTTVQRYPP